MSDLKLTETGDLDMGSSDILDLSIITDYKEEIKQRIAIRLRSFKNDWFADLDDGLPYFEDIFIKNPDKILVSSIFKSEILAVPGVTGLDDFDYDLDISTRELTLTFSAKTNEGTIPIEISLL
jgi:hypothetical protein